jgi:formylglycine-generating enzyme required for sulfatase activity
MNKTLTLMLTLLLTSSMAFAADYTEPTTGMEFVSIPGGSFIMGDNQDKMSSPEHEVTIKPFQLSRYEVTFKQYEAFVTVTNRSVPNDEAWGRDNRPVINVTWYDAVAFTEWLSKKTGKNFRLPSEAEWEYAARGGVTTKHPWGDEIGRNNANCDGCGSQWDNQSTAPVGSFAPNGYGLYDMIGNVYEWCLDTHRNDYHGAPKDGSAWISPQNRRLSIYRGASWRQPVWEMAITQRCTNQSDSGDHQTGFRVVLEN